MRKIGLLLLLAGVLACARDPRLRDAEKLVESAPDSALVLLDAVDRDALQSDRLKADYDYLRATAFYRSYYFLDDDSAKALASAYHFKEEQRRRTGSLLLLLSGVLASLVMYFVARKAQIQKQLLEQKESNERLMSAAEDLRLRLKTQASRKGGSLDTLDRLCEQYYIYEGTPSLQPRLVKEVRSIVEGLRSDPEVQRSLEQQLGSDVMKKLRSAFPSWKEEDYLLYLFTASGFSSTTISALLEKDKPYVYNRLYRIKERIKSADFEGRDELLFMIQK
ncbi:MAG: hypothetical protein J6Y31_06520 [Bacteroidales bacterium]|nr:hypothetical protein [Bacteroidales bacterium]MBP5374548.1 hypothetical protein [Bacteroidales bacterium]